MCLVGSVDLRLRCLLWHITLICRLYNNHVYAGQEWPPPACYTKHVCQLYFPVANMYLYFFTWALNTAAVLGQQHIQRQNGPVPSGTISDCTYFYDSVAGDTCASIANAWGITLQQFITYNPSVKSDCSGLVVGDSYCVEENNGKGPASTSGTSAAITKATTAAPTSSSLTTSTGPSPTQTGITTQCKNLPEGPREAFH